MPAKHTIFGTWTQGVIAMNQTKFILALAAAPFVAGFAACQPVQTSDELEDVAAIEQAAQQQTSLYHSVWRGSSANVWHGHELGGISLEVWEGGTAKKRSASIWFSGHEVDPESYTCTQGEYEE